jgi:hypothetical protein
MVRAGHDYSKQADECYKECGWESTRIHDGDPCVFLRDAREAKVCTGTATGDAAPDAIARWTDDNLLACEPGSEGPILDQLGKFFPHSADARLELPQKYVGMYTDVVQIDKNVKMIVFDQGLYVQGIIEEFKKEMSEKTGGKVLRKRVTPLPVGATREDLLAASTPGPVSGAAAGNPKVTSKHIENTEGGGPDPGRYAGTCRKHIGALNFVQRCTRVDLAFAITVLSSVLDKWSVVADQYLEHLFGYLDATADLRLCGWVDTRDKGKLKIVLKSDASYAPGVSTKGTSGYLVYLVGPHTLTLVAWGAVKQKVESLHTAESELHALVTGTRHMIRVSHMADLLMGNEPVEGDGPVSLEEELHIDAQATEKAVRIGHSEKFGHVRRTGRVSLGWAHRYWSGQKRTIVHQSGKDFVADCMTKSLSGVAMTKYVQDLCLRRPPAA